MRPERVLSPEPGVQTRRERRDAEEAGRRPRGRTSGSRSDSRSRSRGALPLALPSLALPSVSHPRRWLPRLALLGALMGITVVLPLTGNVSPGNGTFVAGASAAAAEANLPATIDVLANSTVDTVPPPAIAASAATATRAEIAASRSEVRDPLPGCDGTVRPAGANGQLKTSDLCTLWDGQLQLRGDAASSLAELNLAFKARFSRDLCVTDAYRTLASQRVLKATKGGLAAVPGRSNHGWGLAIDLCSNETKGAGWTWLKENGAIYGWENPAWALSGGSGPHEPWHWEYTRGVQADGEYYNS
ncbi:M15 family metallopeptidase [Pengzhenrongella frigida]|uniref:M15 family metallopeptidase n=1 Tax=Pengzhenrongella frigida TaxID=1259133 RepID=UPI0013EACD91|nr:M15 family metallopeptidase [Cellulomonas sp. HLT2-17]